MVRHGQEDEDIANEVLQKFSLKHNVKIVPTNNCFYINKEDREYLVEQTIDLNEVKSVNSYKL